MRAANSTAAAAAAEHKLVVWCFSLSLSISSESVQQVEVKTRAKLTDRDEKVHIARAVQVVARLRREEAKLAAAWIYLLLRQLRPLRAHSKRTQWTTTTSGRVKAIARTMSATSRFVYSKISSRQYLQARRISRKIAIESKRKKRIRSMNEHKTKNQLFTFEA